MAIIISRAKTLLKPYTAVLIFRRNARQSVEKVDQEKLNEVCNILFNKQRSLQAKLNSALDATGYQLSTQFFLQVCNKFPLSWLPVYRFYKHTFSRPDFRHSSLTLNRMANIIGKAQRPNTFCRVLSVIARNGLANRETFRIAIIHLATCRKRKRCVQFFHFMSRHGFPYSLSRLNLVVGDLCRSKLADFAWFMVENLIAHIEPDLVTYRCLVKGFCDKGDVVGASMVWNSAVDRGIVFDVESVEAMMVIFFKRNEYDRAMKMFRMMKKERLHELGSSTYVIVIDWLCKKGLPSEALDVFDEMSSRKIPARDAVFGSLVFGMLQRGRVEEAYKVVEGIENPDIGMYHAMIRGMLSLGRREEAAGVFREMVRKGCEPTMHTYVMLLRGIFGRRGRKGHDSVVNFETIFVGGLVKAGKLVEARKFAERAVRFGEMVEVPRFDYNKWLYYHSNEEGAVMFEEVGNRLREVGMVDLADIFQRYGQKMTTRARRLDRHVEKS